MGWGITLGSVGHRGLQSLLWGLLKSLKALSRNLLHLTENALEGVYLQFRRLASHLGEIGGLSKGGSQVDYEGMIPA